MKKWEDQVSELLSETDPKSLVSSLRLFYDCYIEVNDGGMCKQLHRNYRSMEKLLEKINEKSKNAKPS